MVMTPSMMRRNREAINKEISDINNLNKKRNKQKKIYMESKKYGRTKESKKADRDIKKYTIEIKHTKSKLIRSVKKIANKLAPTVGRGKGTRIDRPIYKKRGIRRSVW